MKKAIFRLLFALSCALFLPAVAAQDVPSHDFLVGISPTNLADSAFGRAIRNSDEWKDFYSALTKKLDAGYEKAKDAPGFPREIDAWFQGVVAGAMGQSHATSEDVIDGFFGYVHGIILQADLKFEDDGLNLKPEAVLTLVVRFDPTMFEGGFQFIKKDEHYKILKDAQGQFLAASMDEKVVVGTTRWDGSEYYLIVAGTSREQVEGQIGRMQKLPPHQTIQNISKISGVCILSPTEKSRETIKSWSGLALALVGDDKQKNDLQNLLTIMQKIQSVQSLLRDEDGTTQLTKTVTATSEDDAKLLKDMIDGGMAAVRFFTAGRELKTEEKLVLDVLGKMQTQIDGKTLKTVLPLGKEAVELARFGLKKATAEINNR